MVRGRTEVLPDRDDVDADAGEVGEATDDLVVGLAHADDQPRLRRQPGRLGPGEHRQAAGVAGRRPHRSLQAGHRLDVVVEHVRPHREQQVERVAVATGIGHQRLDPRRRAAAPDRLDARGDVGKAVVDQIVAGDHREHGVVEAHAVDGLGHPVGLVGGRRLRPAGVDEAEPARPGATLAQHHERRGPVGPALRQVRAAGVLAHRHQAEVTDRPLEVEHLGAVVHLGAQPCRLAGGDVEARRDPRLRQPRRQPHRLAGPRAAGEERQVVDTVAPCHVLTLGRAVAPPLAGEPGHDVDDLAHRRLDALLGQ